MSRLTVQTLESAPAASVPYLEAAKAKNGFVPNLLGVLANAPTAIEMYVKVSEINSRSSFTLEERETVQITAAHHHGCAFCVAGHTAICYKQGKLDADLVNAMRDQTPLPQPKLEALAEFTRAVIRTKGAVPQDALQAFLAAGYAEQQVLEVILGVALATLCNFSNTLAGTELNPELAAYRWEPQKA
ncbi:MAG: carboxymuconolactone decarboxylase family protein [Burkholderiaceae bacterium]|nr:carboxymuconolactone decarboxylase family protein [Burkholderiaceae bacterium]